MTIRQETISKTYFCCKRLMTAGKSFEFDTRSGLLLVHSPSRYDVLKYCPFCGKLIEEIKSKK